MSMVRIDQNVNRIICCSHPGKFYDRGFLHNVYNFSSCKNLSIWGTELTGTLAFSTFLLANQDLLQCVALPFGPGHGLHWSIKKIIWCFKMLEIKILVKMFQSYSILATVQRRFVFWRLGQFHGFVTHPGEKWMSPMLTPALVVPCWWDQLTSQWVGSGWSHGGRLKKGAGSWNTERCPPFF